MREILFRGKTERDQWVYGSLILAGSCCCVLESEENCHPMDYPYLDNELGTIDGKATPVIPETVGQFTGLTDVNDTKIFEGDIVLTEYGEKFVVAYGRHDLSCCGCCYDSHESVGFYLGCGDYAYSDDTAWTDIKVIGNIHDNPKLMEGNK